MQSGEKVSHKQVHFILTLPTMQVPGSWIHIYIWSTLEMPEMVSWYSDLLLSDAVSLSVIKKTYRNMSIWSDCACIIQKGFKNLIHKSTIATSVFLSIHHAHFIKDEGRCLPVHLHWPFWSQSFSLLSCCAQIVGPLWFWSQKECRLTAFYLPIIFQFQRVLMHETQNNNSQWQN